MTGRTQRAAGLIVVGVNGAEASLAALRWAVQEALLRQARAHLVFVSPRVPARVVFGLAGDTAGGRRRC